MKTGRELRSEGSESQQEVEEGSVRVPIARFAYTRRAPSASGCEFHGLRPAADPELGFGLNGLHIESCLVCLAFMV